MAKRTLQYCHCAECPADFTYIAPVNGCYKLVNRKWNWDSAGLECRSLHKDAHLVVISDAAEQHEIRKMIDSTHSLCELYPLFYIWLSAHFNATNLLHI